MGPTRGMIEIRSIMKMIVGKHLFGKRTNHQQKIENRQLAIGQLENRHSLVWRRRLASG